MKMKVLGGALVVAGFVLLPVATAMLFGVSYRIAVYAMFLAMLASCVMRAGFALLEGK